MSDIILASTSNIRKKLLESTNISFICKAPTIDEEKVKKEVINYDANTIATTCANEKALSISKEYPKHQVIGADQICLCDDVRYSKPMTTEKAIQQLTELNGKTHQLISAICIAQNKEIVWNEIVIVDLSMRLLTEKEIKDYVLEDQPLFSCGSYKYESLGKNLFK